MPIIFGDSRHALHCNYCGAFVYFVDDDWISHNGFTAAKPCDGKIALACTSCNSKNLFDEIENKKVSSAAYWSMVREFNLKNLIEEKEKEMELEVNQETKTTEVVESKPRRKKSENPTLDFAAIEVEIKTGKFKLNDYAKSVNMNPAVLRTTLAEKFGDNLVSKRGRNGGIFWKGMTNE